MIPRIWPLESGQRNAEAPDATGLRNSITIEEGVFFMNQFIKTPSQQALVDQLRALQPVFQACEPELDARGSFPFANIKNLKKMNYHNLSLTKEIDDRDF